MKKIRLVDCLADAYTDDAIIIDTKEILRFSKDADFVSRSVAEFLNKLPSLIINGKTIKEWFRFRDHSLWWFAHSHLRSEIDGYIRFIIIFENMLETIHPDLVEMKGFYDKAELIRQICRKKNIRLSIDVSSRLRISLASFKKKLRERLFLRGSDIIVKRKEAKRRALAQQAGHTQTRSIKKGCIIYVSYPIYRRPIYDLQDGKIYEGEYLSSKILRRIKEKGIDLLCVDVDPRIKGNFKAFKQRLNDKDQYWMPIETLIAERPIDKELQRSIKGIARTLARLFREADFQNIFNYDGIRLWDMVSFQMDLLLTDRMLPQRIREIEAIKGILIDLEPKSIFLVYERGPAAMAFIIAANELGVKTVGMQHGMIHKAHLDYAINDVRTANSIFGCPVPTTTLVFGEFYKKLLTEKFAYPLDRVATVGNPVYEDADKCPEFIDRKSILARLRLDPIKKIILVATSMNQKKYGNQEYDTLMIETLAKSFANVDNMQVVIKLHPLEDGEVYRQIVAKNKASNFVILDRHPIIELLLICDVFLAVASTTILEAIVLGRPVIIIQASEKVNTDVSSVIENGAAIGSNFEELPKNILKVLDDKAFVDTLLLRGFEFAKWHFNLPDKQISNRIADILMDPDRVIG